jgi:hypothetical protein
MWLLPLFRKPLRAASRKPLNLQEGKWAVWMFRNQVFLAGPGIVRTASVRLALTCRSYSDCNLLAALRVAHRQPSRIQRESTVRHSRPCRGVDVEGLVAYGAILNFADVTHDTASYSRMLSGVLGVAARDGSPQAREEAPLF